jgi:putative addiction module component (TIGR02574 family)
MQPTMKSFGIDHLSIADRLLLVEEIWDSIAAATDDLEIPQSHREELERRLADDDANPEAGRPWAEVKDRLLGKP